MHLTELFIRRPVLACVISALVLVFGLRAEQSLPVRQFPHTVSGTIEIQTADYGADPATIAGFITTPLEGAIAQTQGIDYMTSSSTTSLSDITIHLLLNYDPARALAEVQSYVTSVTSQLPAGVQASSITLSAGGGEVMDLDASSDVLTPAQVGDYIHRLVAPRLQAVPGVQQVEVQGSPNVVMRAWLDPQKLAAYGLTGLDVQNALAANNFVSGAGNTLGGMTEVTLDINSGLHSADEFRSLVVRQRGNRIIRLGDVARVAFGSDPDNFAVIANGHDGIYIDVKPTPSANALTLATALRTRVAEIQAQMPPAIRLEILHDSGEFIRSSVHEVVVTLAEALLIVALVVFAFLGSPRSVLIPVITIPLSLIGTFAMMSMMGFSINLLTLLALVLATGLVVDDAIIVVENVNRHVAGGMRPLPAAVLASRELALPIVAMTVVLIAAYVPVGLQGGLTGALFTEFAFTLAGSVTVSALLALTLSPMMCSRLLRPRSSRPDRLQGIADAVLERVQGAYMAVLRVSLDLRPLVLAFGVAVLVSIWFLYTGSKAELSPPEDQGVMVISGQVNANATLDQMQLYNSQILGILRAPKEGRGYWHTMSPPSFDDGLVLKRWSERHRTTAVVAAEVQRALSHVAGSEMAVYVPPYLPGSWGLPVSFVIEGTGNVAALNTVSDAFLAQVRSSGLFAYAEKDLKIDQPQATIVIDRDKLSTLGITMSDVGNTLNAMLGGNYVGFFSSGERSYKVEPLVGRQFRLNPSQILDYPITTVNGISVPLSSVASIRRSVVPESIAHFQQLGATTVSAVPMPGVTQAQAYAFLQQLARQTLPSGYGIDTVGPLRQFVQESGGFATTFALAIVVTYLALAALFESLLDPLIILVSVPMSIAGALLFVWLGVGGASLNLFTEVGLVTLMGLISKHGILIVEVANEQRALGLSKREAIERACLLRLRPILMTTAAMVLGVLPLVFATGAGAASRYVMGLVIASGLSIGTLFTLFVLPAVYMLIAGRHVPRQHAPGSAREHALELS
ncbi:efflux RND transporter permease subunit [Lichenicoccus roseus]|uniref:Efflux RND transporter permease subunit n=1 Tax=Lichenicoccus roseus TaxID=2683649 RepID=A0A5R9J9J2_9PROT|nr:efflux RND transporter permease subunit [Lichenicoccus roseus]TLU73669.1 efflux RND transporter permease subunit [Lichenicoccus roseus]